MSITVIVALELRSAEEIAEIVGDRWKRVTLPGGTLTEQGARAARTQAFGCMVNAVVAHGWGDAYWVPGRRAKRGVPRKKWSAERTRRLFGNSKEEM